MTRESIASRVRKARTARKLSQPELARLARVSQGTIGNIESGARAGFARSLQNLARALGVELNWLLSGEGDGAQAPEEVSEEVRDLSLRLEALRVGDPERYRWTVEFLDRFVLKKS